MIRQPPSSPLFPYTTLSRSRIPTAIPFRSPSTRRSPRTDPGLGRAGGSLQFPPNEGGRIAIAPDRAHDARSEEHTSELQSQSNLVCRLLLEKKKKTDYRQL